MKTLTKWILVALTSVAIVGCDPFEKANTAAVAVIGAGATDVSAGAGYSGTLTGSTWTVAAPATCVGPGQAELAGFIWVKFNVLLDGSSIQTAVSNCTPAAAEGFVGTPANPGGDDWYTCYNPQSPTPQEGPSVIVFLDPPATAPSGWIAADPLPGGGDLVTPYTATGTVHDTQGRTTTYDVALDVTPDPGVPGTPTFSGITTTSVGVSWTASDCSTAGTTRYLLERAPDVAGAPGTFATVTTTTALTFTDTGLTSGTIYWYQVTAETSAPGDYFGLPSAAASVTTL